MFKRAFLFGLAFSTLLAGCLGAPEDPAATPEEEAVDEAQEPLASCNAPINAHADWILSAPGCTWASLRVVSSATNQQVLYWYAGLDEVTNRWIPRFCYHGICTGGYFQRTGIRGDYYGIGTVSLEGVVVFPDPVTGLTVTVTPNACTAGPGGWDTTITGIGSDGKSYTITVSNTYFC